MNFTAASSFEDILILIEQSLSEDNASFLLIFYPLLFKIRIRMDLSSSKVENIKF